MSSPIGRPIRHLILLLKSIRLSLIFFSLMVFVELLFATFGFPFHRFFFCFYGFMFLLLFFFSHFSDSFLKEIFGKHNGNTLKKKIGSIFKKNWFFFLKVHDFFKQIREHLKNTWSILASKGTHNISRGNIQSTTDQPNIKYAYLKSLALINA